MAVLPFNDTPAARAAKIRAWQKHLGLPIGGYDTLVAGHARSREIVAISGRRIDLGKAEQSNPPGYRTPATGWTQMVRCSAKSSDTYSCKTAHYPTIRHHILRVHSIA
jgi:hypothetical protein